MIDDKEKARLDKMSIYENEGYDLGYKYIAGVDEVGRGPLFGQVVVAAVILKQGEYIEGVNDSKKLSEKKRNKIYDDIMKKAIAVNVSIIDNTVIDKINILEATRLGMKESIEGLKVKADYALIDAEKKIDISIPYNPIIKGDTLSQSIAAASIIAKVTRDRMIEKYAEIYPEYDLASNKGYGTKKHTEAIQKYGITELHRKSFCKKFI